MLFMSYEIGSHFDLTYLNKEVAKATPNKSFKENLVEVGTSFIFKDNLKAFRRIPVVTA